MDLDFFKKFKLGYRLTTLQIIYFSPEYGNLVNEFIWQMLDKNPEFPRTHKFLLHWKNNIKTPIKEVNIAQEGDIYPKQFRNAEYLKILH